MTKDKILIFGNVEFDKEQTKAIHQMIDGWKSIGKKELLEELLEKNPTNDKLKEKITKTQLNVLEECLKENKALKEEINELRGYIKYLEVER